MAVCTICTGSCSYYSSACHLQSQTKTCTGASKHIHCKQINAIQFIGVKIERANLPWSEQHVYAHISVLVPQVFTGSYSIEDDCLLWLFCTWNHHSHRHLKGDDALWCNSGKNKGLCTCAVLGGVSVFLLETSIYACYTVMLCSHRNSADQSNDNYDHTHISSNASKGCLMIIPFLNLNLSEVQGHTVLSTW